MSEPTRMKAVRMRRAAPGDLPVLEDIRRLAFAPIFDSFRAMLGDELYRMVQAHEDASQADLLVSLLAPGSHWEVYAAETEDGIVGFIAIRMNRETRVGEIGLNAIHPAHAGQGLGTGMYEFALSRMKEAGMQAATVATGADASHASARRAYRKAGFTAQIPSVWMCRQL